MAGISGDGETTLHKAFRIITSMQGLKEIDVAFEGNVGRKSGRKVEVLLPLKMVRQAERYDVKAPYRLFWAEGVGAWDGEDDSPWEDYEESEL
ncbi:hypothetical protein V8E51_012588 [Hyaloscypha variabilis]